MEWTSPLIEAIQNWQWPPGCPIQSNYSLTPWHDPELLRQIKSGWLVGSIHYPFYFSCYHLFNLIYANSPIIKFLIYVTTQQASKDMEKEPTKERGKKRRKKEKIFMQLATIILAKPTQNVVWVPNQWIHRLIIQGCLVNTTWGLLGLSLIN